MALDKHTPRPGALKLAISKAGMTQAEFAQKARCSRTTLQKIDRGEPVKAETLNEIAQVLGLPVAHLLGSEEKPEDTGPDQIVTDEDEVFGNFAKVLLRRLRTTNDVMKLLPYAGDISWLLNACDLSNDQEAALVNFEQRLNQFDEREHWFMSTTGPSLAKLIEDKKAEKGIEEQIKQLADAGLYVYGTKYIVWSKEKEMHQFNPYEFQQDEVQVYTSKRVTMIAFDSDNAKSIRANVYIGHPPPEHATDEKPHIKVDGRWLEKSEASEGIPF
jgi:transcriptional regulator with XRE-family HTH domain